jgi:hypothetical protein
MKRFKLLFYACIITLPAFAQSKQVVAFPITSYMVSSNDSLVIVQIKPGSLVTIAEKAPAILRAVFTAADTTTADLGKGKCNLIKGEYFYYGIILDKKKRKPKEGDLVYTYVEHNYKYKGLLLTMAIHNITINNVQGELLVNYNTASAFNNGQDEKSVFTLLVNDVINTGKIMTEQMDNQDMVIAEGRFKGKKVFATMQQITNKDVTDFVKYIIARPQKYAGNSWKFAEIFATWVVGGCPTVDENN